MFGQRTPAHAIAKAKASSTTARQKRRKEHHMTVEEFIAQTMPRGPNAFSRDRVEGFIRQAWTAAQDAERDECRRRLDQTPAQKSDSRAPWQ